MSSGDLVDELRDAVAKGRGVIVAGAGVSVSVTGNAPTASWVGLIEHGIHQALRERPDLPEGWESSTRSDLEQGQSGYLDGLVTAAQKVTRALGGLEHANFRDWLRSAFEDLPIKSYAVVRSLQDLRLPIATTNYDTLIERITSRSTVTWLEVMQHTSAFEADSQRVIHLHGCWTDPKSVVFGYDGYTRVGGAEGPQVLQRAIGLIKSFIFVGCGDGLGDLNFGELRSWLRSNAGQSDTKHFILCRSSELARLTVELVDERIFPVSYGDSHDELPGFIENLKQASDVELARMRKEATAPIVAAADLNERVRRETVLGDHMVDLEQRGPLEMLIPPVLIPVTHEEFARSSSDPAASRYERCDPEKDVADHTVIVVAGDENTGVTSALEWLISCIGEKYPEATPVLLDWKTLDTGVAPVEKAILRYLLGAGALYDRKSVLPSYLIALDNAFSKPASIFRRVLDDIQKPACQFAVLGCRTGAEIEICRQLDEAGVPFALRYIGRLGRRDAESLASLVAPNKARQLSQKVLEIASTEHLPRTPFTLSLLLSALLFGEDIAHANSGTALLDAYVDLLLGRGDIHEDARLSIDAYDRATILAHLAEHFTRQQQGALDESATLTFLEEFFESRDWSENAGSVLANLRTRRVLRARGSQISFSQTSYLYLFAAHRARSSPDFKQFLMDRPVYYSPILRHYAALQRDDHLLLERLDLLLGDDGDLPEPTRAVFGTSPDDDARYQGSDIDELLAALDVPEIEAARDGRSTGSEDPLERSDDKDPVPFPLDRVEEAPLYVQLGNTLGLVSAVLRDSDSITDLETKRRVLRRLLIRWGLLAETVYDDEHFRQFSDVVFEHLFRESPIVAEGPVDILDDASVSQDDFAAMMSTLVSIGGISATLSSRKLMRSLERLADSGELAGDARGGSMGAFLALDMQEPGWPRVLSVLVQPHMRSGMFSVVIWRVCLHVYYNLSLGSEDEAALRDFLASSAMAMRGLKNDARARSRIAQKLQQNKARVGRPKLERGTSPFTGSTEPMDD